MTLSAIILKTQLPIEICGQTLKFMQWTLCNCCISGKTVLRSSDCVTEKKEKKDSCWTVNFKIYTLFLFSRISSNHTVYELHNSEHWRKESITLLFLAPSIWNFDISLPTHTAIDRVSCFIASLIFVYIFMIMYRAVMKLGTRMEA